MRRLVPLVIVLAGTALLAVAPATAAGNQPPAAAAGLDQSVTVGTTVYLDAGGSYDPDGHIVSTEWSIQAPNGSTLVPSCRNCSQPTFTPNATGRWSVTVTVTDDSGATASDTLYVTVGEPRGPAVTLDAPAVIAKGEPTPLVVESAAEQASLRRVSLYHNGSRIDRFDLSGANASVTSNHTFGSTGTAELLAVATDTSGYVNRSVTTIQVTPVSRTPTVNASGSDEGTICVPAESTSGENSGRESNCPSSSSTSTGSSGSTLSGGAIGGGGSGDDTCSYIRQNCDSDLVVGSGDGNFRLVDANGDGHLTMTIRSDVFEGGQETVNVQRYTNVRPDQSGITDDNPINSGDDLKEIDYDEIKQDVSIRVIRKASRKSNSQGSAWHSSDAIENSSNNNLDSGSSDNSDSATTDPPNDVTEHYNRDTDTGSNNNDNSQSSGSVDSGSSSSNYSPDADDRGPPYPSDSSDSGSGDSNSGDSSDNSSSDGGSSSSGYSPDADDRGPPYPTDSADSESRDSSSTHAGSSGSGSIDNGISDSGSSSSGYSPGAGERGPPYPLP